MTPTEWARIAAYLAAVWPGQPLASETAQLWYQELAGYPAELVAEAARELARSSRYLPTLAELLTAVRARRERVQALAPRSWQQPAGGQPMPPETRQALALLAQLGPDTPPEQRATIAARIAALADQHAARCRNPKET